MAQADFFCAVQADSLTLVDSVDINLCCERSLETSSQLRCLSLVVSVSQYLGKMKCNIRFVVNFGHCWKRDVKSCAIKYHCKFSLNRSSFNRKTPLQPEVTSPENTNSAQRRTKHSFLHFTSF